MRYDSIMRFLLRPLFLYLFSLYALNRILPFVHIHNETILITAAVLLFILNVLLKPFIKILWLPINIITLGLFSWAVHIIIIYAVTFMVPGFQITPAQFPSLMIGRYVIPALHFNMIWTFLIFTFLLTLTVRFFDWLLTQE